MIRVCCSSMIFPGNINAMDLLVIKLKVLKKDVTFCTKNKTIENRASLHPIETDICNLFFSNMTGSFSTEDRAKISFLTSLHGNILEKNEKNLRVKSRAIWLEPSDKNTIFFHNFTSFSRNLISIWEICDENGIKTSIQEKIKISAESHFNSKIRRKHLLVID